MRSFRTKNSNLAGGVYFLGTGTSFNIKTKFPNDYQKFTDDNFIVMPGDSPSTGGSVGEINTGDAHPGASFALRYTKPSVSYNASTGVVTVSGNVATATNSVHYTSYNRSVTSVCKVYLSVGQIKNI